MVWWYVLCDGPSHSYSVVSLDEIADGVLERHVGEVSAGPFGTIAEARRAKACLDEACTSTRCYTHARGCSKA